MAKSAKKTDEPCSECGKDPCVCDPMTEDGCKKSKVDEECDKCGMSDGCQKRKGMVDGCKAPKMKVDGTSRVERADYWGPLNEIVRETKPFKETPEGFYQGRAAVTCTGIFRYLQPDGSIIHEFLPPEEAFEHESLETLALKPLTNGHPKEKVTADTYSKVSVGTVGKDITNDAYNVYADISIQAKSAVDDAKAGRTGLSCGYSAELVEEGEVSYPVTGWKDGEYKEIGRTVYKVPGVINGMPYDKIQTKRVYNHLALVDVPRGGDALHLRFDGADTPIGVLVPRVDGKEAVDTKPHNSAQEENRMKKIRLDGATVEHDVPEAVAAHIEKLDGALVAASKGTADAEAKLSAANAALATVKQDHADLVGSMPSKVQEAVTARLALVQKADGFKVAVQREDSDDAIKAAVVVAAMPTVKTDGMDAVKLDAHFEAACALLSTPRADAASSQRQDASNGIPPKAPVEKVDSIEERLANAHKTSK